MFFAGWIGAIVIAVIATAGLVLARELWIGRQTRRADAEDRGRPARAGRPRRPHAPTRDIKLPATIRGFDETDIYAKVPGYMKTIKVDKGDHVHAGELLAIIESPETRPAGRNARAAYQIAQAHRRSQPDSGPRSR